ncbi:MAG: phytanoyl-CoA dioxygenase family protein [Myxococcota bacterium]
MQPGAFALTPAERRAWSEDGFFVRERAFAPEEIAELRDAAERAAAKAAAAAPDGDDYRIEGNRYREAARTTIQFEHAPGSDTIRVVEPFHHLESRLDRLIDDPRLVEPARELVGSERVALFTDKLNLKRPREGSRFRWHQDSPYWAHFFDELHRLPNVMVSLDDAHVGNGCFRVIRGSHRRGLLPGLGGDGALDPLFTHPDAYEEADQVAIEVSAGSLVFFSPHSVHGSQPNASDEARRALVITYQPGGNRMFKVDAERDAGIATAQPTRPMEAVRA